MNSKPLRVFAPVLALLLLTACGSMGAQRNPRDQALYSYVSAVRWSDFNAALAFVDPETLRTRPMTDLESERYKQFQVAGYEVKSASEPGEGRYEQVVELRLVNKNTQVERIITDRQQWRWDAQAKRWWLVSGLPDLDAR
ncbi:MAG: hypothetical protein DCF27_04570 [Lysobacteraceae bacterium]|nr:MAG: hypothetical protein DCF27_04570 [Xanthomonadaceae bacterium]